MLSDEISDSDQVNSMRFFHGKAIYHEDVDVPNSYKPSMDYARYFASNPKSCWDRITTNGTVLTDKLMESLTHYVETFFIDDCFKEDNDSPIFTDVSDKYIGNACGEGSSCYCYTIMIRPIDIQRMDRIVALITDSALVKRYPVLLTLTLRSLRESRSCPADKLLTTIIDHMTDNIDNVDIQRYGCLSIYGWARKYIFAFKDHNEIIYNKAIINAMTQHPSDEKVQFYACMALYVGPLIQLYLQDCWAKPKNAPITMMNNELVIMAGETSRAVITAMKTHPNNKYIQYTACLVLKYMIRFIDSNRHDIWTLVQLLMTNHSDTKLLQKEALSLILSGCECEQPDRSFMLEIGLDKDVKRVVNIYQSDGHIVNLSHKILNDKGGY